MKALGGEPVSVSTQPHNRCIVNAATNLCTGNLVVFATTSADGLGADAGGSDVCNEAKWTTDFCGLGRDPPRDLEIFNRSLVPIGLPSQISF